MALWLGIAGGTSSLNAQAVATGVVARYNLRLSEADGRVLVGEELSRGSTGVVRLALVPEGRAFRVDNGRVVLSATAEAGMLVCPVWISGVPVIAANKLSLAGADVTTDGTLCNGTLSVLKPKALESLSAHPWDLPGRLARASTDPSLPGPRLPASGCLTADQLTLRELHPQGNDLIVAVAVAPRSPGQHCP
jgi:hypothetical protein